MNEFNIKQLKAQIDKSEVISFDVFDTLIFRKFADPLDVFETVEGILKIPGFKENRVIYQNIASEKVEKEHHYPHANLDEIYDVFSLKDKSRDWEIVKKKEIELELDCTFQNSEMNQIYKYAVSKNKVIIATTDMYLDAEIVKIMLNDNGYPEFTKIYDSANCRKAKYNGEIYPYIANDLKVQSSKILHIGDNKISDVEKATKAGWNSYHYSCNKLECKDTSLSTSIHVATVREEVMNTSCINNWEKLGFKIGGPLYLGLITWVERLIKRKNTKKVFFLSRDGFILDRLFDKTDIIDNTYLYASRRSLLLAGITELDEASLDLLPPFVTGQKVSEVMDYLCIEGFTDEDAKKVGFDNGMDARIVEFSQFDNVKELYKLRKHLILNRCKIERENMKHYLESIHYFDEEAFVFDCGWNGSSQYLLDRALSAMGHTKTNTFLYAGIVGSDKSKKQLKGKSYYCYLFDINTNKSIQDKAKKYAILFELFFGAPHSSVLYYDKSGPVFENNVDSHDCKESICEGVKKYINFNLPLFSKYKISSDVHDATKELITMIDNPTAIVAKMIGDLANVDGFASFGSEKKYVAKVRLKDVAFKSKLDLYWPEGIIARTDISFITKYFVNKYYKLHNKKPSKSKKNKEINAGLYGVYLNLKSFFSKTEKPRDTYNIWIDEHEVREHYISQDYEPLISIVVPVYNVIDSQLIACIESVVKQSYKNWELCLVDDCSTWSSVRDVLKGYEKYHNFKIKYRSQNGHIAQCTNDCIAMVSGEYIAFLDCDDILAEFALAEMIYKLNEDNRFDFIYSDEDKLTADGSRRHSPFFKPDWSPDTFMSLMYTCHFSIYRSSIVKELGGIRQGFDGAQDYDFTLRFTERAKMIGHVRKILYHWRERNESIASNPEAKPYAMQSIIKAKKDALTRRKQQGEVKLVKEMYQYRVCYLPSSVTYVSIIIPSKDNFKILKRCIDSIIASTNDINYEIIVIDNGSNSENKGSYQRYLDGVNAQYSYSITEFNFSSMCNQGARKAKGNMLLFLNDDTEVLSENWLEILSGHASLSHIGAVGAKLLYPNSTVIQHVGIANMPIGPSHSLMNCDDTFTYYYGRNRLEYNCLAVTGACLMIEKKKFEEINGFDESFPIAYNDIALCFALARAGYYNVVRNDVILYHYESLSRGSDDEDVEKRKRLINERKRMYEYYPEYSDFDPFYNVNLSKEKVDFSINEIVYYNNYLINLEVNLKNSNKLVTFLDQVDVTANGILIAGWAYIKNNKFNNFNCVKVLLCKGETNVVVDTTKMYRPDVNNAIDDGGNLCYSGFMANIDYSLFDKGEYQVALSVTSLMKKTHYVYLNRTVIV